MAYALNSAGVALYGVSVDCQGLELYFHLLVTLHGFGQQMNVGKYFFYLPM